MTDFSLAVDYDPDTNAFELRRFGESTVLAILTHEDLREVVSLLVTEAEIAYEEQRANLVRVGWVKA